MIINTFHLIFFSTVVIVAALTICWLVHRGNKIVEHLKSREQIINQNLMPFGLTFSSNDTQFCISGSKRTTGWIGPFQTKRLLKDMGEDCKRVIDVFDENSSIILTPIDFTIPRG